jgi:hypothetical protein
VEPAPAPLFLYQPCFCIDYELRLPVRPYVPQPGDIVLTTEEWFLARIGHKLSFSGAPHHSSIVFALPDGRWGLLEGGPENTLYVRILDFIPQITFYATRERVWVRQRRVPLTKEQSDRLTAFALAVADKEFASVRMALEVGPFKSKGPLRTPFIGRPYAATFDPNVPGSGLRSRYYCSELVSEACVAACLLDPVTTRPPSMYPRELFFGASNVRWINRHLDMSEWCPPARFTTCPGHEPNLPHRPWIDGDGCRY